MLNNDQIKAVNHETGSALVYAGPGSGKTTVITHHIKYLINKLKIDPINILVISFSKASALELKLRYKSLDDSNYSKINFGTFHSIFLAILKLNNNNVPDIISDTEKIKIINSFIDDINNAEEISRKISLYKSFINHEISLLNPQISQIVDTYNERLKFNNLMDFDDILIRCHMLLNDNINVRSELKNRFKAILIDEFQDINEYQYETIKLMASDNIFAVGDEDQSIYGFRGATPGIFNKYMNDFKNLTVYNLGINYRSNSDIIDKAYVLISHNKGRFINVKQKSVDKPSRNDSTNNCHFNISYCTSKSDEISLIQNIIKRMAGSKIAILVRTNEDVTRYQNDLNILDSNIINNIEKTINNIIFYYLDYSLHSNKDSLLEIINIPNRSIPRNIFVNNDIKSLSNNSKFIYYDEVNKFNNHISIIKNSSPSIFTLYILNIINIKKYVCDMFAGVGCNNDLIHIIEKVINDITVNSYSFINLYEYWKYLYERRTCNLDVGNDENVKVMTFHASKGLEFDSVIIPDLNEGIIPGRMSINNMNIEEERRLFYVAMTRAKTYLELISLYDKDSMKYIPSRFLDGM